MVSSGGEGPIFRFGTQSGLDRIVVDVGAAIVKVIEVADKAVMVFALPESSGALQQPIDFDSARTFPCADDVTERRSIPKFTENMHMIGHDAPIDQSIA